MIIEGGRIYFYYENQGFPLKIIVAALLITSSKNKRFFWLAFDWNDDHDKIFGILVKHWKLSEEAAKKICTEISELKNTPMESTIFQVHSFNSSNQRIQITGVIEDGKRLIFASPLDKRLHELKPSDQRWAWLSERLDPDKFAVPTKSDLLNILGNSKPKERLELISGINQFYDNINNS